MRTDSEPPMHQAIAYALVATPALACITTQGHGSAPARVSAGTALATVLPGTTAAPAPEHAPVAALAAPTDSGITPPQGEQATVPDSSIVVHAATTTEVRGFTTGLATMAGVGPSTASSRRAWHCATRRSPRNTGRTFSSGGKHIRPGTPIRCRRGSYVSGHGYDRASNGNLHTGFSSDANPTLCL